MFFYYLIFWNTDYVLRNYKLVDIIGLAREEKMFDVADYFSLLCEEHEIGFLTPIEAFDKLRHLPLNYLEKIEIRGFNVDA